MKKNGILNRELSEEIAGIGHGQIMMIVDAGFPIPEGNAKRIDLAIAQDYPDIFTVFKLILGDIIYERCIVAEEQKLYNPVMFEKVQGVVDRCPVETVPHTELVGTFPEKTKVFVRTGSFMPWGNIVLQSGIDAPLWFQKEGVITPDYYLERVSYKEKVE